MATHLPRPIRRRRRPSPSLASWTKDPLLHVALLVSTGFHGGLLASGSYRGTYDAYVHIFFADHYRRSWFQTWEPRWYTGFSITGYPPGAHQLVALGSQVVGLELAFAGLQLLAVLLLIVGVYRFSCLWVTPKAAGWAALGAAGSSSVAEVVHVFGQLPTTLALALLLNAQPSIRRWVRDGQSLNLGLAVALLAATTACHHVTTLFGSVFFSGPVVLQAVLDRWAQPLLGEVPGHPRIVARDQVVPIIARRLRRIVTPIGRAAVLGVATVTVLILVVLAYWVWTSNDPITQVPIPHGSRSDFLEDTAAGLAFFVIPWASCVVLAPAVIPRLFRVGQWPLAWAVALLALLGTGGTTRWPQIMLGGAFDILTLDRFTIWATIAILPFVGEAVLSIQAGASNEWLKRNLGRTSPQLLLVVVGATAVGSTIFAASFGQFRPLQPDPIDPQPIVEFLAKDDHERWRYLTLGFGDQMAWLGANTTALSVDGNYHSARRLPELTSRSVERLEGAKFRGVHGLGSLQQFVGHPARYHLKFVFSADAFYDPLMWANGWHRLGRLNNGVMVWEKADIPPLPDVLPSSHIPAWQRVLWGLAPITALTSALLAMGFLTMGPSGVRELLGPYYRNDPRSAAQNQPGAPPGQTPDRRHRRLDHRLWLAASRLRPGPAPQRWNPLARASNQACILLTRRPSSVRRHCQQALAIGLLGWPGVLGGMGLCSRLGCSLVSADSNEAAPPDQVVVAFYDHLDFRRFHDAYGLLAPSANTPSELEWNLERSVRDGLFDGYAKLDSVRASTRTIDDGQATVNVELVYLTSITEIVHERTHDLVLVEGQWRLQADERRFEVPPEPFTSRVGVNYFAQGRRQITEGRTSLADVLDRPVVALTSARLVRKDGTLCIVGSLINLDVDPADVTVDVTLRGANGIKLAEYSAATIAIHKVLPGEEVPFRIEIEGRAGIEATTTPTSPDFAPGAFTQPVILEEIRAVELGARAVVTSVGLERDLAFQNVWLDTFDPDGAMVTGRIRNDGTSTATVPHLFVSTLEPDGSVAWVDDLWVSTAVRAQRSEPFALRLTDLETVEVVDVPIQLFANGQDSVEQNQSAGLRGPDGSAVKLSVVSFYRSDQP